MTRVLVVDDSRFIRTVVGDALTAEGYTVEVAPDGESAVEAVTSVEPDVVTMDVEMPGIGGIEAVERIMATRPTPIVMLSAHTRSGAAETMDALARGAMDVIEKPDGSDGRNLAHLTDELCESIEELVGASISSLALARTAASAHRTESRTDDAGVADRTARGDSSTMGPSGETAIAAHTSRTDGRTAQRGPHQRDRRPVTIDGPVNQGPVVVIGASTGGPRLVEEVLATLPRSLDARIVVVQHMPADFTDRFAARLDDVSEYAVREAESGMLVTGGDAVVAPGDAHLEIQDTIDGDLLVSCSKSAHVHGVRPSIDVTMESVASVRPDEPIGVVLSGMGRDGVSGIEAMNAVGATTFAQDERTSPVFGIPRRAIETGAIDEIVPIDELAHRLANSVAQRAEEPTGGVETNG